MSEKLRMSQLKSIKSLAARNSSVNISSLLSKRRLGEFKIQSDFLSFDYSKQRITSEVLQELLIIPKEMGLKKKIRLLMEGGNLNYTEDRSVTHTLYRKLDKHGKYKEIKKINLQILKLKEFINNKNSKNNYENIIAISIGGSRLGPELISEAFKKINSKLKVYFCSSFDLYELEDILALCDAKKTLIIITSKSFETKEVLKNAFRAKEWLKSGNNDNYKNNLLGVSANLKGMTNFGIKESNQFQILDSIGGRYSIWSSVSLPAILNIGWEQFEQFKEGAALADEHFLNNSWNTNIPVLMALFSLWNLNGLEINNLGIFTYHFKIRSLTKYLAQMAMESNGKTVDVENLNTPFITCPLVWGGYGPESQHSVFQWLLQGVGNSACDFIGVKENNSNLTEPYNMLLAQITALTIGQENTEHSYKTVEGNNPVSLFSLNTLEPKNLGFLIACYEHKVFVESQIYGINAFDQWGVQLGKSISIRSETGASPFKDLFDDEFLF